MNEAKSNLLTAFGSLSLSLFLIMMFPTVALPAQTAITESEYKSLLENPAFNKTEQALTEAYKAYLASAKNEAEKKEIIQDQRRWITERDKEASTRFKKGSPAYVQFLIDQATYRVDTLHRFLAGNPGSVKADGHFDTLDYDEIPYDGIIRPEHRQSDNSTSDIGSQAVAKPQKSSPKTGTIEWLPPAEAAKLYYKTKGYPRVLSENIDHPIYLLPKSASSHFASCTYDKQKDPRYYNCVYSACSLIIHGKYDKKLLASSGNRESDIEKFIQLCPKEVTSAKIAYDSLAEKARMQAEVQRTKNKERREAEQARAELAERMKGVAVSRVKDSRYKLFSDSSYPTIGEAFDAFFSSPRKWQGSTSENGQSISVSFEGIAVLNGNKAKFVVWFTGIDPTLVRDDKSFRYNMTVYVNGNKRFDNNIGDFFAAVYLNN
jgi:Uncharacterized protein conserved in bacteria